MSFNDSSSETTWWGNLRSLPICIVNASRHRLRRTRNPGSHRREPHVHGVGPRCHHMLQTLQPSQSEEYAQAHDAGILRVMDTLLALSGNPQEVEVAHNIASLPMRLGAWV